MKTIELNDATFETFLNSGTKPVLLDFKAVWCPSCLAMETTLEYLADEMQSKAIIAKVDVDTNPLITAKFGIRHLPTFMLLKNGVAVERIVGAVPGNLLLKKMSNLIAP